MCWLAVNHPDGKNLLPPDPTTVPIYPEASFVINLPRRSDRRAEVQAQFDREGIPFEFVPAVDGRKVPNPANWQSGPGAFGCWRSHLTCLERAMSAGVQCLAVYEDDAVLRPGYAAKLRTLIDAVTRLDPAWDAIFPGGQHRSQYTDPPRPTRNPNVVKGVHVVRTHAYIVRGKYIPELYRLWTAGTEHVDHVWSRDQERFNIFCPRDWLVAQGAGHSDISGKDDGERWWPTKRVGGPRPTNPRPRPCGSCRKKPNPPPASE